MWCLLMVLQLTLTRQRWLKHWPKPRTLKDLRSFLGFASYYRRFVPHFAQRAKPLHQLVSKLYEGGKHGRQGNKPVEDNWNQVCQAAFDSLKQVLTRPPVLAYPIYSKPFAVEVDASNDGLGALLSQEQDGQVRPIAYASRALRGAERNMDNYSSRKLELVALKWAITEKFRVPAILYLHSVDRQQPPDLPAVKEQATSC